MKRQKYLKTQKNEEAVLEYFSKMVSYNKDTGVFIWNNSCKRNKGMIAGTVNKFGYRKLTIKINNKLTIINAHRLAWFLVYGKAPESCLDHINGKKDDNRIKNLRCVTDQENQMNRLCHRKGILWGTHYHKSSNLYGARVRFEDKVFSLGYYKNRKQAHVAAIKFASDNGLRFIKGDIK